jgi:hypothetical protein
MNFLVPIRIRPPIDREGGRLVAHIALAETGRPSSDWARNADRQEPTYARTYLVLDWYCKNWQPEHV